MPSDSWQCQVCGWIPPMSDGIVCLSPEMLQYNDGYDEQLFVEYETIARTHFWFVGRSKLIFDTIRSYCPVPASMLEIGCASGYMLEGVRNNFPAIKLFGAEPSLMPLKMAAQRIPECSFIQLDARRMPFINEFDLVGAFDVLEHIDDDTLALQQMHQACRTGGSVVLTVPQHPWLWSQTDIDAQHKRRYTRKELIQKVAEAGFDVKYVSSFMTLLLPAMCASRLAQRNKRDGGSLLDDGFKIGTAMNKCLGLVFDIERALLSFGIKFPVGGSLLLVAQKIRCM